MQGMRVYGFPFDCERPEVLPTGCDVNSQGPNDEPMQSKTSLVYLGSVTSPPLALSLRR